MVSFEEPPLASQTARLKRRSIGDPAILEVKCYVSIVSLNDNGIFNGCKFCYIVAEKLFAVPNKCLYIQITNIEPRLVQSKQARATAIRAPRPKCPEDTTVPEAALPVAEAVVAAEVITVVALAMAVLVPL